MPPTEARPTSKQPKNASNEGQDINNTWTIVAAKMNGSNPFITEEAIEAMFDRYLPLVQRISNSARSP